MLILFLAAVVPPLYLMARIYKLDKIESEPPRLIARLFLLGCFSVIFAAIIEGILEAILGALVQQNSVLYRLLLYFLVVALTEEGVKYACLRKGSWNSPDFNYRFDAVVYAAAVTLGFAAAENIEYVFMYGLSTALVRAATAIPGHCIFGIYMGYYYGMAKYHASYGRRDQAKTYLGLSLIVPVLLHGFYDFCATAASELYILVFYAYIIILDIIAIRQIRKLSREDRPIL